MFNQKSYLFLRARRRGRLGGERREGPGEDAPPPPTLSQDQCSAQGLRPGSGTRSLSGWKRRACGGLRAEHRGARGEPTPRLREPARLGISDPLHLKEAGRGARAGRCRSEVRQAPAGQGPHTWPHTCLLQNIHATCPEHGDTHLHTHTHMLTSHLHTHPHRCACTLVCAHACTPT